jgi:hypothetical protein
MKLCIHCNQFKYDSVSRVPVCSEPSVNTPDPVYGTKRIISAESQRSSLVHTDCGPCGQFWKERIPETD